MSDTVVRLNAALVRRWAFLASIPLLSVCGESDAVLAPQPATPTPVATQLQIDPVESEGLTTGQTRILTVRVLDQFGATMSGVTITWTSTNELVASVTSMGGVTTSEVTTKGLGEATITATTGSLTASVQFTVTQYPELTLITEFGNQLQNSVLVDEIFAVWWHKDYDLAADAAVLLADLAAIRLEARTELGLWDPPNPGQAVYYNVYLHDPGPGNDNYPDWGNGQGTDMFGRPYLTLPLGAHQDPLNVFHEGLHIFQYSSNSPGFEYAGDAAWYIEATANWYAATKSPTAVRAFLESNAIYANPQQTAWHGFWNGPSGDPENWQRLVHQYGMNSYLYYLTEVEQVRSGYLMDGFYAGTSQSPQEYLYRNIDDLRTLFGNWAAHNVADFDYMTRAQWNRAVFELEDYGDPDDINPYVATYTDSGTDGAWAEPEGSLATRGWGYNVVRVNNTQGGSYTIDLEGTATGSEGAGAYFEVRVVVRSATGDAFHPISLSDGLTGSLNVTVTAADHTVYLVVAAVPEHFAGNQTYPYRYKITRN